MIRSVLSNRPDTRYSVSCTTRQARAGEIPGRDYHFIAKEEFVAGIRAGRFLEWAEVHGEFYGTDRKPIEEWLKGGSDVLVDIDVQGARQVRCSYPSVRTIFILPPSLAVLEVRLKGRGTETPEQLAIRVAAARRELLESPWYDFVIVNAVLEEAVADLDAILRAGRCRLESQAPTLRALLESFFPIPR